MGPNDSPCHAFDRLRCAHQSRSPPPLLSQAPAQAQAPAPARPAAPRVTSPKTFSATRSAPITCCRTTRSSRVLQQLAKESDRSSSSRSARPRRAATAHGHHHLAGQSQETPNYKEIARRLALAEGLTDDRRARSRGKARPSSGSTADCTRPKCWARSSSSRPLPVRQQQRRGDAAHPERLIILVVHANPDGMELVSDWYMKSDNRSAAPTDPAAVPEVHRARQQPRLLHERRSPSR